MNTIAKVEEKLFQNRYKVDAGRPHITIKNPDICAHDCKTQQCSVCCPAGCYTTEGNGRVVVIYQGSHAIGPCPV
jgi:ferredoxin like protein